MSSTNNQVSDTQKRFQQFMSKLGTLKTRFNSAKGQADGIIIDGMSMVFEQVANEVTPLYQEIEALKIENEKLKKENESGKPTKKVESKPITK